MFLINKRVFRLAMVFLVVLGVAFISSAVLADDKDKDHREKSEIPAGTEMVNTVILKKVITFRESPKKLDDRHLDFDEVIDKKVGILLVEAKKRKNKKRTEIYRFNSSVEVFDGKKRRISMDDLPVPCRAKLYYYKNKRKAPYLYRIEVVRKHKGARKSWHKEFRDI